MAILRKESYTQALDLLDGNVRRMIRAGEGLGLVEFGFGDIFMFDGVEHTWDDDVPSTDTEGNTMHGVGVNLDKVELCMMSPGIWEDIGADDEDQLAKKFGLKTTGQMKWNPRSHVLFSEIS